MTLSSNLLPILAFVLAAAPALWWSLRDGSESRVKDRLRRLRGVNSVDPLLDGANHATQLWFLKLVSPLLTRNVQRRSQLQQRLAAAGMAGPLAVHAFVAGRMLLLAVAVLMASLLPAVSTLPWDLQLPLACALIAASFVLPGLWLDRRKTRRHAVLLKALPDFLDLLVTCAESGLSLEGGLKRVTTELRFVHPVLAADMERVQHEIEMGATPEAALQHLAARADLEAIRTLASFVQHARRFGGSIIDALRTHSDMLRDRREQRAEELAQMAAVKILFPTLLLIFPAVFVVVAGPAVIQLSTKFGQ